MMILKINLSAIMPPNAMRLTIDAKEEKYVNIV